MLYTIKEFLKSHRTFYRCYYYVISSIIYVIRLFVKTDNHLILFVSYGGKHFADSPKNIFECMIEDDRFNGYHYVWAFIDPSKFDVPQARKINIDSFEYILVALKARVWITNVVIERALNFRGKKTFYLCTSHGIPLKGKKKEGNAFQPLSPFHYDVLLAQSECDARLQQVEFNIDPNKIKMLGYPRNDKFAGNSFTIGEKVRRYYNILQDKQIILYAPTYRDWNKGYEHINIDIEKWRDKLEDKYVLLFRAHPTVMLNHTIDEDHFFKNVTKYEDLDELLMAADVLISDYSSMFFDYSIMHKPMICWAYDYAEFCKYRYLRVDLINEVYGGEISEDNLIDILDKGDFTESIDMTRRFQEKYVTVYGNSSKAAVDLIYSKIVS